MPISPWLWPVLWREHDWRGALARLGAELVKVEASAPSQRAAVELARALEYVEPDRRRAIAAYELAGTGGDLRRARDLAGDLGWAAGRARLSLAARAVDPDPLLVLDEAEAWWDAGQPALCALALDGLRGELATSPRALDLAALLADADRAVAVCARAATLQGTEAADAHVMVARFALAGDRTGEAIAALESALVAAPGHALAARWLLGLAIAHRDVDRISRCMQLRIAGLELADRIDGMRASALALIESGQHRGLGLRVLRQALDLAYDLRPDEIPGHLAMWAVLLANAGADGTRIELLPLVIRALQSTHREVDRVWLGALATELSLRDARNPVVAGAYAEIVTEFAPEHPIVRELVAAVAAADPTPATPSPTAVPPAAVRAATQAETASADDIPVDIDEVYADATEAAVLDSDVLEADGLDGEVVAELDPRHTQEIEMVQVVGEATAPHARPHHAPPTPAPRPSRPALGRPAAPSAPPPAARPPEPAATAPVLAPPTPAAAPPKPAHAGPQAIPRIAPPISVTRPARPSPAASPAALPRVPGALPALPRAVPVLAALRTPDRPELPPRPPTRADALPRARRIAIPIDVVLVLADGARVTGHSRDISVSGLFVLATAPLALDVEVGVELQLPGKEAFTEDEYQARARVARIAEGGFGLELIGADAGLLAALAALA